MVEKTELKNFDPKWEIRAYKDQNFITLALNGEIYLIPKIEANAIAQTIYKALEASV